MLRAAGEILLMTLLPASGSDTPELVPKSADYSYVEGYISWMRIVFPKSVRRCA